MIKSIGTDIVDIDRFRRLTERWGEKFVQRILTQREIEICKNKGDSIASMAARFAAKEAMIKCLPTNKGLVWRWHEMEVLSHEDEKPFVKMNGKIGAFVNNDKIHISLSHSQKSAIAFILLESGS